MLTDEDIAAMVMNLVRNWDWRGVVSDGYSRSNEEPLMAAAEVLASIEAELKQMGVVK